MEIPSAVEATSSMAPPEVATAQVESAPETEVLDRPPVAPVVPSDDCSVRVAVRLRPLSSEERFAHCEECIHRVEHAEQIVVGKHSFTFDHALSPDVGQHEIYEVIAAPLLRQFLGGYNATILAYGQTGSGKTFTMGSQSSLNLEPEERGIIPRFIADLVTMLKEDTDAASPPVALRVQFLEVYGEEVNDLLNPLGSKVTIREIDGQVVAQGASEVPFSTAEEVLELLEKGTLHRSTGATNMNARSSRSHAIFTIVLDKGETISSGATGSESPAPSQVTSKFHFVDLAGSERAKRTGATGKRLREGIDINRGLLTLGNVISALGDEKKRGRVHVPYRDSKLTRMLQDSLGGNSKTVMICCVSPSDSNMSESLNALRYANRARNIQNRPVVNRDPKNTMIIEMQQLVGRLAKEVLLRRKIELGAREHEKENSIEPLVTQVNALDHVDEAQLAELASENWNPIQLIRDSDGKRDTSKTFIGDLESSVGTDGFSTQKGGTSLGPEVKSTQAFQRRPQSQTAPAPRNSAAQNAEIESLQIQLQTMSQDTQDLSSRMSFLRAERDFYRSKWADASPDEARALLEYEDSGEGTPAEDKHVPETVKEKTSFVASTEALHNRIHDLECELREVKSKSNVASRDGVGTNAEGTSTVGVEMAIEKARKALKHEEEVLTMLSLDKSAADGSEVEGHSDIDEKEDDKVAGTEDPEMQDFQKSQQRMGLAVQELAKSIDLKEEMLVHLESQMSKYAQMKAFYETRLNEANMEIEAILSDRQKLLEELQGLQEQNPEPSEAMEKERQALLGRLKTKEEELKKLRRTQRELQEHAKIKLRSEKQIHDLERDLTAQKKKRADLVRRMNIERKKQANVIAARGTEISSLRRQVNRAQQAQQRFKVAESQHERREKKHMEDIAVLRKKVTELKKLQKKDRSYVLRPEDRQMRRWLQDKMRQVAEKEERISKLESEYKERLGMLEKREYLESQKQSLKDRRDDLNPSPERHGNVEEAAQSSLRKARDAEQQAQRIDLDLLAIEEQLEDCNAALEYKQEKILALEEQVSPNLRASAEKTRPTEEAMVAALAEAETSSSDASSPADEVCSRILESCQGLDDAGSYIRILFGMLRSTNVQFRKARAESLTQAERLKETEEQMELSRRAAEQEKHGYERRLLDLRRENDAKFGGVLEHLGLMNLFQASQGLDVKALHNLSSDDVDALERNLEKMDLSSALGNPDIPKSHQQALVIIEILRERHEQLSKRTGEFESAIAALQTRYSEQSQSLRELETKAHSYKSDLEWRNLELRRVQAKYRELRDRQSVSSTGGGSLLQRLRTSATDTAAEDKDEQDFEMTPSNVDHDEDLEDHLYESLNEDDEIGIRPNPNAKGRPKPKAKPKANSKAKAQPMEMRKGLFDAIDRKAEQIGSGDIGIGLSPSSNELPVFDRLTNPQFYTGIHKPSLRPTHGGDDEERAGSASPSEAVDALLVSEASWPADRRPSPRGSPLEEEFAISGTAFSRIARGAHPNQSKGTRQKSMSDPRLLSTFASATESASGPVSSTSVPPPQSHRRPRSPPPPKVPVLKRPEALGTQSQAVHVGASGDHALSASGQNHRWLDDYRKEDVFSRLTSVRNFTGIHRSRAANPSSPPPMEQPDEIPQV